MVIGEKVERCDIIYVYEMRYLVKRNDGRVDPKKDNREIIKSERRHG